MQPPPTERSGIRYLLLKGVTWKKTVALAGGGGGALVALQAMVTREHSRIVLRHLGTTPEFVGLHGVLSDLGEGLATWIIALTIAPVGLGVAASIVALHLYRSLRKDPDLWTTVWFQARQQRPTGNESFDRKEVLRLVLTGVSALVILIGLSVATGAYVRDSPLSAMLEFWFLGAALTTAVVTGAALFLPARSYPVMASIVVLAFLFAIASLSTLGDARSDAQQFQDGNSLIASASLELDLGRWCQADGDERIEWSVLRFDGDDIYVLEAHGVTHLQRSGSWLRTPCDG